MFSYVKNEVSTSDIVKNIPPPNPLLPKSLTPDNEPLRIGGNIHFLYFFIIYNRKLKKQITSESTNTTCTFSTTLCSTDNNIRFAQSLKSLLTTESPTQQIVYEKLYLKSLPQRLRDSYFLTEMYNVKRLLKHNNQFDENIDIRQIGRASCRERVSSPV